MDQGLMLTFIADFDYSLANFAHSAQQFLGDFVGQILRLYTYFGNGGIGFIVVGILLLLFKPTRKAGLIALIAMLFGALMTNVILKLLFSRPRPFWDQDSIYYTWWVEAGSLAQGGYSFPSGHATNAMAFSGALFYAFKKRTSWLHLLIALLMGFTRIYFMVHFATDVLAGFVVGFVCATGALFSFKGLLKQKWMQVFINLPSIYALFKKKNKIQENTKSS